MPPLPRLPIISLCIEIVFMFDRHYPAALGFVSGFFQVPGLKGQKGPKRQKDVPVVG
jgi:hypothetical protein